ncbi:hypothetical protein EDB19DRAFT_2035646 [Suillus lakei]|nr:hypothetical protein EDB19DRAFT_2035646 [Suillus lakei]
MTISTLTFSEGKSPGSHLAPAQCFSNKVHKATAIDNGFTHLDGVQIYANEDSLGAAVKPSGASRSALFAQSTLARLDSPDRVAGVAVKELGLDYVVYLVHRPALNKMWKIMEWRRTDGGVEFRSCPFTGEPGGP